MTFCGNFSIRPSISRRAGAAAPVGSGSAGAAGLYCGLWHTAGDHCIVAEAAGKVVGAAWCRIMEDYGHIDNGTPSLAISLLPEYRGQGTGTQLLNGLLCLLRENGYQRASLSVQKENPALRLYQRQVPHPGGERYRIFDAFGQPSKGDNRRI